MEVTHKHIFDPYRVQDHPKMDGVRLTSCYRACEGCGTVDVKLLEGDWKLIEMYQ